MANMSSGKRFTIGTGGGRLLWAEAAPLSSASEHSRQPSTQRIHRMPQTASPFDGQAARNKQQQHAKFHAQPNGARPGQGCSLPPARNGSGVAGQPSTSSRAL